MTAVLAVTHEPVDWVAAAVVAAWCLWTLLRSRCECPGPCRKCPPLTDDTEADTEYRATRHLFTKTTAPGRNPGRR